MFQQSHLYDCVYSMGVNVEIIHMVLQIVRPLNNVTWIFGEIPFISHLGAIFSLLITVEQ